MTPSVVHEYADQLRQYATHFAPKDWAYTRNHDIKHIRYRGDWSGYDHPVWRLKRLLAGFVRLDQIERDVLGHKRPMAWRHPIVAVKAALRTRPNLPDGVLDDGGVIVHWEEVGEYLQYVQPSVGALLADLMDAHPDLPEVVAIATEMKRINDDYGVRVAAENGDDE